METTVHVNILIIFCKQLISIRCPTWQLSPAGLSKLMTNFTNSDRSIQVHIIYNQLINYFSLLFQWKLMFTEMFRLRRNWLKGYCTVRTFEGHTQGIEFN